ncbi:hypothetical protein CFOL_v3_08453, partial [Cephalotus follicularis]
CYYCDEKFILGHKCRNAKTLIVLEGEEIEECDDVEVEECLNSMKIQELQHESTTAISLYAMMGQHALGTLRLQGQIAKTLVQILINGGSTHNFSQDRLIKFL